jgi:hypothetical protein
METTYKSKGEIPNRIVEYSNLYFKNGKFYCVSTRERELPGVYLGVHYLENKHAVWTPSLESNQDILAQATKINGQFYFGSISVPEHPGHTIFDDCIAEFSVLSELGKNMQQTETILADPDDQKGLSKSTDVIQYDVKGIYKLAFGSPAVLLSKLHCRFANHTTDWLCLESVIVGAGERGLSNYNEEYESPGRDTKLWWNFRCHLLKKCQLKECIDPLTVETPFVTLVYSKNRSIANFNEIRDQLSRTFFNYQCVDWGEIQSIEKQLEILSKTSIYVTMDGSCALNCVFLPKNAVMINLGVPILTPKGYVIGWLDDYLYPVLDYIKVVYLVEYSKNMEVTSGGQLCVSLTDLMTMINQVRDITDVNENKENWNNASPNAKKLVQINNYKSLWSHFRSNNLACACTLFLGA